MVVAAGLLAFSLGVSAMFPRGFGRTAALVIAAVSTVALIAFHHPAHRAEPGHDQGRQGLLFPLGGLDRLSRREVPQGEGSPADSEQLTR